MFVLVRKNPTEQDIKGGKTAAEFVLTPNVTPPQSGFTNRLWKRWTKRWIDPPAWE